MNRSASPHRAAGVQQAPLCLLFALLPIGAISATSVAPEESEFLNSRPYLLAVGSPALRFAEATPPPDLTVRPPVSGPPSPTEDHPIIGADPAKSDLSVTAPATTPTVISALPESAAEPVKAAPAKVPPPILPDDTRPKVRAEDFLPFFQFPAAGNANGDVTVVAPVPNAPAPAPLPPSSATYRQQ